jgi:3-dehydroquinate synthetase
LLGLPGSGKSAVGRHVAQLLGWSLVDTDDLVEARSGLPIVRLFAEQGEPHFRALEAEALAEAASRELVVVATGGGAVLSAANRAQMSAVGWRVTLEVAPEVALARLAGPEPSVPGGGPVGEAIWRARPLLAGDDPLGRLRALAAQREAYYAEADDCVATDSLPVEQVAARVLGGLVTRRRLGGADTATAAGGPHVRRVAPSAGAAYDAAVEWGGLACLGERLAALGLPPRLHVVSDRQVGALYGPGLLNGLRAVGFAPELWMAPAGEASKSRAQLDALHDWLAERRAERREALVAVGGGVVGDLAGFAAATYLRGVPLIHVPTSLLAQVDASIGGKVGINHPRGKNLLGAFHQPCLTLADPATLLTQGRRTRTEGWAEVVKHGAALDATYFAALERDVAALLALEPVATVTAIAGSVDLKATVVEGDEREHDDGRRLLLNYGHTIGHAL